jgi:glycosyltransferase involved in cell wall biosynthesis
MKNRLLLLVPFGSSWIGGVYYVRNFLYTLTKSSEFAKLKIDILCPKEHMEIFSIYSDYPNVRLVRRISLFRHLNRLTKKAVRWIRSDLQLDVFALALVRGPDGIFPIVEHPLIGLKRKLIYWVPDLQHKFLPEMFSASEILERDAMLSFLSEQTRPVVFSSRDARNCFIQNFPKKLFKDVVIPFASSFAKEDYALSFDEEMSVLKKFGLLAKDCSPDPYIYIPNQLWKHKNHLLAFEAFEMILARNPSLGVKLVCTGSTKDYRFSDYYDVVKKKIDSSSARDRISLLGFIDRNEQTVILKHSLFVLQPSLFEGWNTGVEEAKAAGKFLVLSDIPIHREQVNSHALYFNARSAADLAECLLEALIRSKEFGLADKIKRQYSVDALLYPQAIGDLFS